MLSAGSSWQDAQDLPSDPSTVFQMRPALVDEDHALVVEIVGLQRLRLVRAEVPARHDRVDTPSEMIGRRGAW